MNIYRILLVLSLFYCIGCQNDQKDSTFNHRNCDCPMADLPDEKSTLDSTYQKTGGDDLFDWNIGGKISGNIKKMIDAEIGGNIKSNEDPYQVSTKKIIERIDNSHPELITKAYSFKVGKVFYCTFYTILCQDATLSDKELAILSSNKLEEFRKDFTTYTQPQQSKEFKKNVTQPKIKTEIKGDGNNTFTGDGNNQEVITVTSHNQKGGITANQVNIGSVPRALDMDLTTQLLENLKNKNENIDITCILGDPESFNFATLIKDFLISKGYKKLGGVKQSVFSGPLKGQFFDRDSTGVKILIGSNEN